MKKKDKKVRVLFLAEELRVGGAETYFYRLESMIDRTQVGFFSMAVPSGNESKLAFPQLFVPYTFSLVNRVKTIVRFLGEREVDVIHANSLRLCFAAIVAKVFSKSDFQLVYTKHNITKIESMGSKPLVWFINHCVDALVPICETDESLLISQGVKKDLVHRINNGVDLDRFMFRQRFPLREDRVYRIGILARLSPEKRHDLFLEVARQFHLLHSKSAFLIGGDGPEYAKITQIIEDSDLAKCVSMLGKVEASAFLDDIDALLLVSDREVMPMSILEGMASGCAIIARAVGGVGDVVREDTGTLVQGSQADIYVRALERVYKDRDYASKTTNARALVEREYSLAKALEQHVDLYYAIVGCGGMR